MKKIIIPAFSVVIFVVSCRDKVGPERPLIEKTHYLQNRAPLKQKPYLELPLGSIKPQGWLLDQLERMRHGLTGNLDEIYPEVMGKRNGWLGGDGDGWERGPYWIDGLLPLAYILDDETLKNKVKPWIEWTMNNQQENGYLGPIPFEKEPMPEEGLQKSMRQDWWPKMVMLKVLQQYHSATGDPRVVAVLLKYFRYQRRELPETPLDHWTFWANRRGGDNLQVIHWLYNITGEEFLLELGDLVTKQTFPWTHVFLNEENQYQLESPWHYFDMKRYPFDQAEIDRLTVSKHGGIHCVNLSQGLKQPIIVYQQDPDQQYVRAVKKALRDIRKYHGQPQGMFGGDEGLHGNNPVQGVEFCSIAETMFSLESMVTITGDMEFADLLERIVYNALPAQASDDFMTRQYFQAANQVELTDTLQTSYQTVGHKGTDFVFGVLTGYPCCTSNMHQAWPKYVQNLWYATHDNGVAALLYAPSEVTLTVAGGAKLKIKEETGFPFREDVRFKMELDESAAFPFHIRIPAWAVHSEILINGEKWSGTPEDRIAKISRTWNNGDEVNLRMPMELTVSQWYEFSAAIERGPLVYSLRIRDEKRMKNRRDKYKAFEEVFAKEDWNFALHQDDLKNLSRAVQIKENNWNGAYPWNLENAPIELRMRGIALPEWKLHHSAPLFPAWWGNRGDEKFASREITLVPYGCTTLRITEFPVYDLQ
ncbi:MAG: beta-L-arabinofuranosidase domain-containing protein [Cyclobacteriaceae bacterium]